MRISIRVYAYWADTYYVYILVRIYLSCTVYISFFYSDTFLQSIFNQYFKYLLSCNFQSTLNGHLFYQCLLLVVFISVYQFTHLSNLDIALVYCYYLSVVLLIVSPCKDEDDYSTTIMHPSRNSYTAPTALYNDIAKSAEHVSIS